MPCKHSIFTNLLSTLKRRKRSHATNYNDNTANAPPPSPPPHMFDSAFCASTNTESKWEDELERVHQLDKHLVNNWHQALEQLTSLLDKLTSPFLNTDRISLHRAQLFIESYRDDRKNGRHGSNTYSERIEQVNQRFSDQVDLKQCATRICELEKDLFNYRQIMDQRLASLWDTQPDKQAVDSWKEYLLQYHHEVNQMESKFKTLLETSSPNPDEYTCAVCLSIFTDPITLQPCLHTFCKDCIQHIYCTCQLSHCDSPCHDATNRPSSMDDDDDDEDDDNDDHSDGDLRKKHGTKVKHVSWQLSSTYKPRYRSMIPPKDCIPTPSSPISPRRHSYLRSPLKRFTNNPSSTMTQGPITACPSPLPSPPSSTGPTTTITVTEDEVNDDDSALEISSPSSPITTLSTTVNINAGSVILQCSCPLSWSIPPAAQCPLCRHPFGPEDCTPATALDNLIRFYFPRRDKVRQRYNARQRQLKRRSFFNSMAQKWLPSSFVSVPLPSRRLPPAISQPSPAAIPMVMI